MPSLVKMLRSSVAKKFLMSITGLALVGFVITHLLGNLLLYKSDGQAFNKYAYTLESFGVLLEIAEIGLVILFGSHIVTAVQLKLGYRAARPDRYVSERSKGAPSKSNLASRNMVISGSVLAFFLVAHIWHFKFGPGQAEGYVTQLSDVGQVRDLHRWVVESFKSPLVASLYVAVMVFLGLHLRHGFWSAFQSWGVMGPRASALVYGGAAVLALLLAGGFLFIPVWIYFGFGG
jgi:succinate dehydrogenase / fumarate reductase cytochrome b subunit